MQQARRSSFAFVFALAGALAAPRIAHSQHYIDLPGTQPNGLADGAPLDSATNCGICHFSRDATMSATTAMPYDGWIGSMMGSSMRDPLFLAALTVAEQDSAGIGDWCLRCHTPGGFTGGRTRGTPTASNGSALTSDDRQGVTCDSCHRMVTTTNLGNAQYQFDPSETRFGPYPTIVSIRHPGAVSTWQADSRACATCHEITNPQQPQRAADGTDTGRRFPLDSTYREWASSAYAGTGSDARTCVDCHMPRIGMPGRVSTNSTAMLRDNPRRHELSGGNAWMIRVVGAMRSDVASGEFYDPDSVPFYEAGARRAENTLRTAASVALSGVPTMANPGDHVSVTARITNLTGHRLPTGYGDGRRVWLELAVIDGDGHTTVVSGAYDDAAAHLDTTDTQLKLYTAVAGRAGMGAEDHLALHDTIVRDTRLPPLGFQPPAGLEPVGADYSGGAGGTLRNWDDATYAFTVPTLMRGPLTVRVRARFQVTTREYVEALAAANHTDTRGADLLRVYNASGRAAPYDMAVATANITIPGVPVATPDAGTADGSVGDAALDGSLADAVATDAPVSDARATDGALDGATDAGRSDVAADRSVVVDARSDAGNVTDAGTVVGADTGVTADAGTAIDAGTAPASPSGCGCHAVGGTAPSNVPAGLALALGLAVTRRRRRRSAAQG